MPRSVAGRVQPKMRIYSCLLLLRSSDVTGHAVVAKPGSCGADLLPIKRAHYSVPPSMSQQEKVIGMVCGPRIAGVSRQVGVPASAGRRARIFGSAAPISRRATLAPRQWWAP